MAGSAPFAAGSASVLIGLFLPFFPAGLAAAGAAQLWPASSTAAPIGLGGTPAILPI
jgi:hypothetical protein